MLTTLGKTQNYSKDLEKQLMQLSEEQIDPEEFEEILIELESHKKALKGLTNQYNAMENLKDELQVRYNKLKASCPEE